MAIVRVKANVNIFGLEVGDIADVDDTDAEFAALVAVDFLTVVPSSAAVVHDAAQSASDS